MTSPRLQAIQAIALCLILVVFVAACGAPKQFRIDTSFLNSSPSLIPMDVALYVPKDCYDKMSTCNLPISAIGGWSGAIGNALCPEFETLLRRTFRSVTVIDNIELPFRGEYRAIVCFDVDTAYRQMSGGMNWLADNKTCVRVRMAMYDLDGLEVVAGGGVIARSVEIQGNPITQGNTITWEVTVGDVTGTAVTHRGTLFTIKKNQYNAMRSAAAEALDSCSKILRNSSAIKKLAEEMNSEGLERNYSLFDLIQARNMKNAENILSFLRVDETIISDLFDSIGIHSMGKVNSLGLRWPMLRGGEISASDLFDSIGIHSKGKVISPGLWRPILGRFGMMGYERNSTGAMIVTLGWMNWFTIPREVLRPVLLEDAKDLSQVGEIEVNNIWEGYAEGLSGILEISDAEALSSISEISRGKGTFRDQFRLTYKSNNTLSVASTFKPICTHILKFDPAGVLREITEVIPINAANERREKLAF